MAKRAAVPNDRSDVCAPERAAQAEEDDPVGPRAARANLVTGDKGSI